MIFERSDLPKARRIVIKAGTSVVSNADGFPSLSRMANIVENAARLIRAGKEVLIVTSGAIGVGRQRLRKQSFFRQSMSDLLCHREPISTINVPTESGKISYSSACAAAGQLELMTLYETLFSQYDIPTSQLLVTAFDFTSPERRTNIQYVITQLLALGLVPIINENDAVSANQGYQLFGNSFSDNDSLAALVSIEMKAHLTILLTDVIGVFDRPPSDPTATLIDVFDRAAHFQEGEKSLQGRGGMGAKVDAALRAIDGGVEAVVITAGVDFTAIERIMRGEKVGTLFLLNEGAPPSSASSPSTSPVDSSSAADVLSRVEDIAAAARTGGRVLQAASSVQRTKILMAIAAALQDRRDEILRVNELDIAIAEESGLAGPALKRLKLTNEKLDALVSGIEAIAAAADPLGVKRSRTELAEGLILDNITCPIGVLLIIFESRPDCLPQIAALAVKSGNGLILKGGKEAEKSNQLLHAIITEILEAHQVPAGTFGLASRAEIPALLKMDSLIDLVIPRGSGELVQYIKRNTSIPVMGHAEGVCHVYVDADASAAKALAIVVDSKTDYPSACNAAETVLLHETTLQSGLADRILRALRVAGVAVFGGPAAVKAGLTDRAASDLHTEYGDLAITVEVVSGVQQAVQHVHTFGSGHTECIITENPETADYFLKSVDSACVFHNASTRFADGYRFGLGAEVGISTGRIHARGPVGVEGLLTSKWILRSNSSNGHTVASFAADAPQETKCVYTHRKLE